MHSLFHTVVHSLTNTSSCFLYRQQQAADRRDHLRHAFHLLSELVHRRSAYVRLNLSAIIIVITAISGAT
jgi:hypothetical protein